MSTSRLTIKYIRVSERALYASLYGFKQYIDLVNLLYAGFYIAKT
jgi:hypothetical protein